MKVACLFAFLLAPVAQGLVFDIGTSNGNTEGLHIHMCYVPVLASLSDQRQTPDYQFSLAKGGTIDGTLEVTSLSDDIAPRSDISLVHVLSNMDDGILSRQNTKKIQIRRRKTGNIHFQDHYNWYQLLHNVYVWASEPFRRADTAQDGDVGPKEEPELTELSNVYLLLLSKAQYELYITSEYWRQIEPSGNKKRIVYNSHIIAEMRIPITEVGRPINFSYRAKEDDLFTLFVFNADEKKLALKGNVTFLNPGNDHLPVEMKHFQGVMAFWEVVFLVTGMVAILYLALIAEAPSKTVNYLLAVNFVIVAAYLQLDRWLLQSIMTTGTYSNILWTVVHLVRRLHEIYVLTTLVLLALGWKVLREEITELEYRMLFTVCTLSCVIGFIAILINGVDVSRYAINTISFIAILIATNFNSILIQSRISEEGLNNQAGRAYSLMKGYTLFRIGFLIYIFKPLGYSMVRGVCMQSSAERMFVWDEHLMLFLDLLYDYFLYCLYFFAFRPVSELPLFKHLVSGHEPHCPLSFTPERHH